MASTDISSIDFASLQLEGFNSLLSASSLTRLKVGIDFGTTTSSVCYDKADRVTHLQNLAPAGHFVTDKENNCHLPTVATILRHEDDAGQLSFELLFGPQGAEDEQLHPSDYQTTTIEQLRMFKLDLLPDQFSSIDSRSHHMLAALRAKHQNAIQSILCATQQVSVHDPFLRTTQQRTITSIDSIIKEYLNFLLQSAKAHFALESGFVRESVEKIFGNKTDVAISVPTMWDDSMLDRIRELLHEAGYPKTSFLLSEAKSAAFFHLSQLFINVPLQSQPNLDDRIFLIVDIGGGTTDIACVAAYIADQTNLSLGQVTEGVGSLDGSQQLNERFKEVIHQTTGSNLSNLAPACQKDHDQVLEALEGGFEMAKRNFDRTLPEYRISPTPELGQLIPINRPQLRTDDKTLLVSKVVMTAIFDDWISKIVSLIQSKVNHTRQVCAGKRIEIALTGWGSLPPYVRTALQKQCQPNGIDIHLLDLRIGSPVACGNYLSLLNQQATSNQFARVGYGIMEGARPKWIVKQNDDLSDATRNFAATGRLIIKNPSFPLDVSETIIRSSDGHTVCPAGPIGLRISSLEQGGLHLRGGTAFVHLEFSVRLRLEGLLAWLVLTIPHGGRFDAEGRNANLDLVATQVVTDLYQHVARAGDDEAMIVFT